jgi:hypothetical protein
MEDGMSTSLAVIEPQNLSEAMQLASTIATSALLPEKLRNKPADILFQIMTGREMGITVTQALRGIHIIEGKPSLSSDLMLALCLRRKDVCEYFRAVEVTDQRATFEAKRVGNPPRQTTFTIEDAKLAGLAGKDVWKKYPKNMLSKRAIANLAREVFPDLTFGMVEESEVEELRGGVPSSAPLPATEAPAVIDAEVLDEVEALRAEIRAAESLAALDEIRARLMKATAIRDRLRADYNARRDALTPKASEAA